MGTGIGKTQQRILDELAAEQESLALTVADLAARVGASDRQVRAAVRALERRGLVVITKEYIGWKGQGEYGTVRSWYENIDDPDGEYTRYEGSYYGIPQEGDEVFTMLKPRPDGTRKIMGTPVKYRREYHQEPGGMPTAGLLVWLPERRITRLEGEIESGDQLARSLGGYGSTSYRDAKVAEIQRLREL